MTPDELLDRLIDFAARLARLVEALPENRLGRHIAGQLARSGTAPAPNYAEACAAESRNDFVHKIKIVLKELRESYVWLRMIGKMELLPEQRIHSIQQECDELCRIFGQSIVTAKGLKPTTQ